MQRTKVVLCSLALSALALVHDAAPPSAAQQSAEPGHPTEPPERMRVEVGDEVLVLDVGGEARLSDGRTVRAALEPTRHLVIDGSFSLDYPREWKFIGLHGIPVPVDAWWNVLGASGGLDLRRHGLDAAAVVGEYAANLEASGWTRRRDLVLEIDGRSLAGFGFDIEMGSLDGQPATHETQEVFGWRERDGVAWLLVVTTFHGPVDEALRRAIEQLERRREPPPAPPAETSRVPGCTLVPELAAIVASFRFAR